MTPTYGKPGRPDAHEIASAMVSTRIAQGIDAWTAAETVSLEVAAPA